MIKLLLIDADLVHARELSALLAHRGIVIQHVLKCTDGAAALRQSLPQHDLVVVDLSERSHPWLTFLRKLRQALRNPTAGCGPLFLCISGLQWSVDFQILIERSGARYAFEE